MTPRGTLTAPTTTGQTLDTLAVWYFTYCEAKNLQPRTLYFYRQKLRYLLAAYGDRTPETVSLQELRQLTVTLQKDRKWSTQQTNHFVTVCRQFFNYLVTEELTDVNPTKRLEKVRQEKRLPQTLRQEDMAKLLQVAPATFSGLRNRIMMLTLLDTGLRLAELLTLDVHDMDLVLLQFRVFGKGRKERLVPFSSALAKHLAKYLPQRAHYAACDALWVNLEGQRVSPHYFAHTLRDYSATAKVVPSAHAHLFRHTFATEFLRNGGNPQMLQRILGHTTHAITQRYVHITDVDACANHRAASPLEKWQGGSNGLQAALKDRNKHAG